MDLGSDKVEVLLADNADKSIRMQEIHHHASKADVVVLQAPGHDDGHMLMQIYKQQGKKVVVDYDDYSFDLSPSNPRYADLGTKECEAVGPDGKYLYKWRDGENGFDLKLNISKYEAFVRCVRDADLVTTTTEYLANKFRVFNPNVKILPNSVDFDLWKPIPRPKSMDGQVRIGWFGGDSHYQDLGIFKTVIPRILKKYPQVKIVLQCPPVPQWREYFKDIPEDRLDWKGWAQLKHYTLFLAARQFDIGLCPLQEGNEFNTCKSNIKMLEFAAVGAPSVCQNMLPYSEGVTHGKNVLLASTDDEWFDAISSLVEDQHLRKTMGRLAYEYAHTHFNLEKNCRLWEKAYSELVEAK